MNRVYIIAFVLLIITAVFAKKEYFTDPTNINNDIISRFVSSTNILTPAATGTTAQQTAASAGTTAQQTAAAAGTTAVQKDISDNDVNDSWKSQFNGMQFLKDIRSVVRDEIIANNMATSNTAKASIENKQAIESPASMQGKVFSNPAYDMNQYIRKDSIPCYACSLDY